MDNKLKYIAMIPFVIIIVSEITDIFNLFTLENLICIISFVFVIIGLLISKPIISSVGFLLNAIRIVVVSLDTISWNIENIIVFGVEIFYSLSTLIIIALLVINYVLLAIAGIKLKHGKTVSIIASGAVAARLAIIIISDTYKGFPIEIELIFWGILLVISSILYGVACDCIYKNDIQGNASKDTSKNNPIESIKAEEDTVEKLIRLKNLLDMGAINQEEFDAKKKQLLGL